MGRDNYNDISSCDSQRHLLGESTDGDSNEDDEGVDQGVAFLAAIDPQQPLPQPTLDAQLALDVHSRPAILIAAASTPALVVDEFYNATRKALHPNTIIPKVELGWWKNHKMRKKKKAEEREKVELELQKMREDGARLAELNANL